MVQSAGRVLAKLRAICLGLEATVETASWGHPNFRSGKRIFAAFHEDRDGAPTIWIKVDALQGQMLAGDPRFSRSGHGTRGWVGVCADRPIDWAMVRELLREGHRLAQPKRPEQAPAGKPRAKGARRRSRAGARRS
jgi:predicted DNA-binding protein (MmcQ/YjbR family)